LIAAAIRDDNPVLYFEHKFLYRRIKEDVPDDAFTVPIGAADIKREGSDLSVIAYSVAVYLALEAADKLAGEGISVEVVDMRSLYPYDKEAIARTVQKTGRALIAHEDWLTAGVGAEFARL